MRLFVLPLLALLARPVAAQPEPGDCVPGTASAMLDANDVRATVFAGQNLFFAPGAPGVRSAYVVPAGDSVSAVFAAALWVAGKVDGELRVAGATYSDFEFWPGPLGEGATSPDDCADYDRVWVVSREDVARYLATGEATRDLLEWPVELGAPVLDGDGIEGNYDLGAGDQPAIRGDQTAWWVMNDAGNTHETTGTPPLGVEVRAEAFAAAEETPEDGSPTVGQATFYRYLVTNRTANVIDDAYVSLYLDADLGNPRDDYVGSDTLRQMGYVYNGDNLDESVVLRDGSMAPGYGAGPPALGIAVLRGPEGLPNGRDDDYDGAVDEAGERLGLTAFTYYVNGGPPCTSCGPPYGLTYYNIMQGKWTNGLPMFECGLGINCLGPRTTFAFHGDPATGVGWSEVSAGTTPGDRRVNASVGPFRLDPGETEEVVFALVYGRGRQNLHSVNALRAAADEIRVRYDLGALGPRRVTADEFAEPTAPEPPPPSALRLVHPAPNPFTGSLTLRYEVPAPTPLRLTVYDALGREVALLFDGTAEAGQHEAVLDGAALAPGVYFVRLAVPGGSRALTVTRAAR